MLGGESGAVVHLLTGAASAPVEVNTKSFPQNGEVWRVLTTTNDVGNVPQGPEGSMPYISGAQRFRAICLLGGGVLMRRAQSRAKPETWLSHVKGPIPAQVSTKGLYDAS